jgi:2-polyprenyl-6-methoxyphenol hydroxylase-like FAD-dependent oxidoreductase
MTAVGTAAVVGGGLAGLSTAILLAEAGVAVDVIEVKADLGALGSGITLQGNALRVLHRLGIWEGVERLGYGFSSLGMRAPDGTLLVEIPDVRASSDGLPGTVGMYRPDLSRLLAERAVELGVRIRTGVAPVSIDQDDAGVRLRLADGSLVRADLLVGADGVRSWTRREVGVDLATESVGMGIWRAFAARPASITRTELCYGGAAYIAGFCPTGEDTLYAYLVEDLQDRGALGPDERLATMRALAENYHGPWDDLRANLTDPSRINYTRFESHLLDGPWHRGRVVLIGDAVHCCPPTLAQGAAQALEDALVLGELIAGRERLDEQLWAEFTARRQPRAKAVVQASVELCTSLRTHDQGRAMAVIGGVQHILTELP